MTERELLDEGRRLLLIAFGNAYTFGRGDWRRVRAPDLKNRLSWVTRGAFSESTWGVKKFLEFLRLFPTVVAVDTSDNIPGRAIRGVWPTEAATLGIPIGRG